MQQAVQSPDLTLAAASNADLLFANRVAATVEERLSASVTVVEAKTLSPRQPCHALVSSISAPRLASLLNTLGLERTLRDGRRAAPPVLIHPHPDEGLFSLAERLGLPDVIGWPQGFERWSKTLAVPDGEEEGAEMGTATLLGISEPMRRVCRQIARIAAFDTNVLVVGETGTGKECVAQALHRASRRRLKPMVGLNCAALPEHLIESELFGYERGAFTGANGSYPGKFGLAEGGTLFLDEIGEMPHLAQAKILRAIESREYYRLGGSRVLKADVRLIAATHRDLEQLCASRDFRLDLYFRLNVARIELPPLRERPEDIPLLARHFIREGCRQMGVPKASLSEGAIELLRAYQWPGNVRELRSLIEVALINADGDCIETGHFPAQLTRWMASRGSAPDERARLMSVLEQTRWNKTETARLLNWSRMKLYRKLRFYGLQEKT